MKPITIVLVAAFLIAAVAIAYSYVGSLNSRVTSLSGVEVRDYQGQPLSSINDFRENSIKGPQYVDINNYTLSITGLADSPMNYTYDEVLSHQKYSKVVTLHCVEGWSVTIFWEGIRLRDLFNDTGVKPGANTVIFHSYDGYSTSLPLDFVQSNNIMIAYRMNGVTLPPERGYPFQLVAESEWGYKWAKWITGIELSNDSGYEGYWESRGYSNNGSLSGPTFE
jgi:DMSO/TMAO reductase YedYZ molybdopterin-dependent catalytic subunit